VSAAVHPVRITARVTTRSEEPLIMVDKWVEVPCNRTLSLMEIPTSDLLGELACRLEILAG
jgi:hypothetical protein